MKTTEWIEEIAASREQAATHPHPQAQPLAAFAGIHPAILQLASVYSSPLLAGPPLCEELVALVRHMFTDEQAELARHITMPLGASAVEIAGMAERPVAEVEPILEYLANVRGVIFSLGTASWKRYFLLPLVPGVFEMVLMHTSEADLTDWHREFAARFRKLFETGYFGDYGRRPVELGYYLPVREAIPAQSIALPSDHLDLVLDRYKVFGVGLCQCRLSKRLTGGDACSLPMETCITFGGIAERLIQNGRLRKVTRRDVFTIKAEAEDAGLVTLMLAANLKPDVAGISSGMACSCCSDCCYALKVIRDFNAPGIVAAPHFRPNIKALACTACGRCVSVCPVSALTIDPVSRKLVINPQRCIGCGLCSRTCARHAIEMRPVPNYHHPPQTALGLAAHALPNFARNVWRIWRRRTRRDAPASER